MDLCLILGVASITTLIFKKLKQPLVLAYIIAGILVGPYCPFFPGVVEVEGTQVWAEIGVVFLLFSLGLEFSFRKLAKVGSASSIMALTEVIIMLLLGYLTGKFLGWGSIDSIFLGGILSISSTTIIIKAFEDLGMKTQRFVGLVFGVLIIEDLVAILLLVLLSTIALSQQFAGTEMLVSLLKLGFFLMIWFLSGILLIPTFLKRTSKLLDDEMLLIISVTLCLLMVILAVQAGFSQALGAFIIGSILAETTKAEKIESVIKPVKNLFGAIFFVSVGMLINPEMIVTYAGPILIISLITIVGKFISITGGGLMAGQGLRTSIQSGMSVSQIGEFSFIIATLGLTLKVTSDFLYPIAVAVSVLTTFTTPYLIRYSELVYRKVDSALSPRWQELLNHYTSGAQTISATSDWQLILKSYILNLVIYAVVLTAIVLLADAYLHSFVAANTTQLLWADLVTSFITLIFMVPFLWALAIRHTQKEAQTRLWATEKYRGLILVMRFVRIVIAVLFVAFLLNQFISTLIALTVGAIMVILLVIFSKRIRQFYITIEDRFIDNLNEREIEEARRMHRNIAPWDAHLTSFDIKPTSSVIGQTLVQLQIREKFGVNIAVIERGDLTIMPPSQNDSLYPRDRIYVFGTDEQIEQFRQYLDSQSVLTEVDETRKEDVRLQKFIVSASSRLLHRTIRESGIRENTKGLIVGIERGQSRILNPSSNLTFEQGDILWIVGSPTRIKSLEEA
ncbi:cation:proton antiporter [Pontibacter burrus]|uniref:Sodium:proton antiporter n=1 Tax=Pontibacter burrus TaxID=2704466 RepID=A0A6B3LY61_9BACT|nr:cation:proton antiporter [Pontibacter burrus]NEM98431.1 sodium:proton antiporter [Pontibacter burrus]